ncbi:MAG: sugar transferase [Candidatus Woesearchaeota archaeon]
MTDYNIATGLQYKKYCQENSKIGNVLENIIENTQLEEYKEQYRNRIREHKKAYKDKRVREIQQGTILMNKYEAAYTTILKKTQNILEDIFFTKYSLGKDGKILNIYKFQTMIPGSDFMFNDLAKTFGLDDKGNLKYDPRVTKIGKVMRKFWIDEWPQLINLIRGDIKLVGIRPMGEEHWKSYGFKDEALRIKPGWLGVNYAKKEDETLKECMHKYIESYNKNPVLTDIRYFGKIAHNILFKKVRSS